MILQSHVGLCLKLPVELPVVVHPFKELKDTRLLDVVFFKEKLTSGFFID